MLSLFLLHPISIKQNTGRRSSLSGRKTINIIVSPRESNYPKRKIFKDMDIRVFPKHPRIVIPNQGGCFYPPWEASGKV